MITPMIAEAAQAAPLVSTAGMAVLGAGIGIGIIGMKAAESTGRNPASFGKVLVIAILLAVWRRECPLRAPSPGHTLHLPAASS